MKNLIFILVVFVFSCSFNQCGDGKGYSDKPDLAVVCSSEHETENKVIDFDILKYKKGIDSLLNDITRSQSNLLVDTLEDADMVFFELKNTPLMGVVAQTTNCIKYSFPLEKGDTRLKHHFVILVFDTESKADSIFSVFENTALEKSGVPGLTYTSDYLVRTAKIIYWINSSCAYSYANHSKFVGVFKEKINLAGKTAIKCECGQVRCITTLE